MNEFQMEFQTFLGCFLIGFGLLAYLAADDVITALPGNILFFVGVIVICWGSESNSPAQAFFWMAVASLVFIFGYIGVIIYNAKNIKR